MAPTAIHGGSLHLPLWQSSEGEEWTRDFNRPENKLILVAFVFVLVVVCVCFLCLQVSMKDTIDKRVQRRSRSAGSPLSHCSLAAMRGLTHHQCPLHCRHYSNIVPEFLFEILFMFMYLFEFLLLFNFYL